jgi:prepilin-type N-terminal cleavage/methylation domain-containing protein
MRRRGFTLIEVLVALTLVAIQVPAVVATVSAAATLTRRAEVVLESLHVPDLTHRCHRS